MRIGRWLRAASAEEGLSPAQSAALATLVREGPMRPGDLAAAEALNPTMLSRVAGHLAEAGLVERTPDPQDGRASLLRATPAGERLIARLRARRAALLVERVRELEPEQARGLLEALPALEALAERAERGARELPEGRS